MKKTLAILLSLALVICMIPATASVAFATESTHNVILKLSSLTCEYNGTAQTPNVSEIAVEGHTVTSSSVQWKKGESTSTTVTDVGEYVPFVTYKIDNDQTEYTKTLTAPTFEVKKYDLTAHKVSISVDNQVADATITMDSVHFFVDGSEATGSLRSFFTSNFDVTGSAGTATVTEKSEHDYFTDDSLTATYKTVPSVTDGTTITPSSNVIYDGTVKNIKSLVSVTKNGYSIGTGNYDVTCSNEVKNAGKYTLTVKGIGEYAGSTTCELTVKPKDSKYVSISSIPTQVEGKIDVDLTVTDTVNGKTVTLVPGTDYNVSAPSFVREKNSTTYVYSVEVLFKGNYATDRTVEFDVVKSEYDVESAIVYQGNNAIGSSTVFTNAYMYSAASQPLSSIVVYKNNEDYVAKKALSTSYYTINYEYDDTKTGKTVSTTAPTEAKTYRVYVVGRNGYAGKKLIGTYTIPKYDMQYVTVSVSMASAASVPSVTVKSIYENITFVKDKDYTVYYSTNISNGKVYVSVTPTADGNLTGSSKGGYYPIVAKSIASCSVSFTNGRSSAAYTGSTIPVDVTVKDGYYTTLTKGTHYTVTYKNAAGTKVASIRDAGTYTVIIEGIGAYSGSTTLTFTVIGTDISGYTVTLKEAAVNATGYAQTPVITSVKKGYYYSLTSNDYTVSYQDSTGKTVTSMSAPGTYKVVVTGKNGYSGSTYATFRIVGLPQTVTVTQNSYKVYATSDSFKITAKASGDATGFTYTSSNPAVASVSSTGYVTMHKVGRAVITVTATGMKKYDPAYETVEVKVYPKKAVQTKKPWTDGKKYQAKVRWTYQDGATSYQVRYSRDKNFGAKTYKTKTVKAHGKDYTTQSTTLTGLKSKSTYYIKVRAVYKDPVTGDTYYGAWSGWRSVKTK